MNKKVIMLPIVALLLSGCTFGKKTTKRKKTSSVVVTSNVDSTSQGGGGVSQTSTPSPTSATSVTSQTGPSSNVTPAPTSATSVTSQTGPSSNVTPSQPSTNPTSVTPTSQTPSTTPTPSGSSTFDFTAGTHTTTIDFVTNYSQYKNDFSGFVDASSGLIEGTLGGLAVNSVHCFVASYSGSGYLMMQNNKSQTDWTSEHGVAFFGSTASLGTITEVSFTTGANASTAAVYNVAIVNEAVKAEGGYTGGTVFNGTGGKVSGSGSYFVITQTNAARNGQIATLTVTYTIS